MNAHSQIHRADNVVQFRVVQPNPAYCPEPQDELPTRSLRNLEWFCGQIAGLAVLALIVGAIAAVTL